MLGNLMENHTNIEFRIIPFSSSTNKQLLAAIFSTLYLMVIIVNSVVITVISLDAHLHTLLYIFFCNLSMTDICYTTIFIPKPLYILLSGNNLVSFTQCFTQIFLSYAVTIAEVLVLFAMGYDRYVAICHPLHYHQILSMRNIALIMAILWVCAFISTVPNLLLLMKLTLDRVVNVHQLFCDGLYILNTSHGGSKEFYIVFCTGCVVFTFGPFISNVFSYIKIFGIILRIKSREARRKTFSTCSSHLIVMVLFYTTGESHIIVEFHHVEGLFKQILAVCYTTLVPMINPLVYSLSNSEIKKALQRWMKVK